MASLEGISRKYSHARFEEKGRDKKNRKSCFHCSTDEISVELSNTEDNPREKNCRKLVVISSAPNTGQPLLMHVYDKVQREVSKKKLDSLTLSSPSFFDVAQCKRGGGEDSAPLHNFLSFNPNLIKLSEIDHRGMLYLLIVMYCT